MTRDARTTTRPGFTLVELLVAMAVIVTLSAIALLVVPNVMSHDRTTDAASLARQWIMISKARAARDSLPRGVRLIVGSDPNNPAKTNTSWVTEVQYIEAPPIVVPNPVPTGNTTDPQVQIVYTLQSNGSIQNRQITITNLSSDQVAQAGPGSVLSLPLWGIWIKLPSTGVTQSGNSSSFSVAVPPYDAGLFSQVVARLDANMGAGTSYTTYHFGLYGSARPLLGEPTLQMPSNTCIDLASSSPSWTSTSDFDILFSPNGQVIDAQSGSAGAGQINLWVRDYTKNGGNLSAYPSASYQAGGEQQIIALKTKSGALGVFPVAWTTTPFQFAQQGATGYGQ